MTERKPSEWRPCALDPEHPGRMIQASVIRNAGPDGRFYCNQECRRASMRKPRPECMLPSCELPARPDGVYCGAAHYAEHLVERNSIWAQCGWDPNHPPIRLTPSKAAKSGRVFCGRDCFQAFMKANARPKKVRGAMGRPKVAQVVATCQFEGCTETKSYYAQRVPKRPLCPTHRKLLGSKIPKGDPNVACALGADCSLAVDGQPRVFYRGPTSQKRFCSTDCRQQWERRNEVTLICGYDGREFVLPAGKAKGRKFCSDDHMWLAQIKRERPDRTRNGRPGLEDKHGYIWVYEPDHPKANRSGRIQEHVVLMWEKHGPLPEGTEVHHINRIPDDNRLENLSPETPKGHARLTAQQRETDRQRSLRLRDAELENERLRQEIERLGGEAPGTVTS